MKRIRPILYLSILCAVLFMLSLMPVGCAVQPASGVSPTSQPTTQQIADAHAAGVAQGQQIGAAAGGVASAATGNPLWGIIGPIAGGLVGGLLGTLLVGKSQTPQGQAVVAQLKAIEGAAVQVAPLVVAANPKAAAVVTGATAVLHAIETPAPVPPTPAAQ